MTQLAEPRNRTDLKAAARDNLWLHFSPHPQTNDELPMIVRGEGAYIYDDKGRKYLDGLAGLFTVQVGHGRTELADVMARQGSELRSSPCGPLPTSQPRSWPNGWHCWPLRA